MEVKCNICGTINDGSTNFCKGCFQKLDVERNIETLEAKKEPIIEVPIEEEKEKDIPWVGEQEIEQKVNIELPKIEQEINFDEPKDQTKNESNNEVFEWPELNETKNVIDEPIENELSKTIISKIDNEIVEEPIANDEIEEQVIEENLEVREVETPIEEVVESQIEIPEEKTIEEETTWNTEDEVTSIDEIKDQPIEPVEEIQEGIEEITWDSEDTNKEKTVDPIPEIPDEVTEVNSIDDWTENENNDWVNDVKEEKEIEKKPNFIIKFLIIYLISSIVIFGTLLFTTKFITNMFDESTAQIVEFIIYRIAMLAVLLITTKITFLKYVPNEDKFNKVTFSILSFVAIPGILIQLFILGFVKDTKVLLFTIGIILAVITLEIFFSYIRNIIRKKIVEKTEDKILFIYGIVSIVLVIVLLGFGMFARTKNMDMPKINFLYDIFHNEKKDNELITNFIYEVEKNILRYQTDDPNYIIPTTLTDVSYATYNDATPDSLELTINENGGVVSGTITYRGITYQYSEGTIKE